MWPTETNKNVLLGKENNNSVIKLNYFDINLSALKFGFKNLYVCDEIFIFNYIHWICMSYLHVFNYIN